MAKREQKTHRKQKGSRVQKKRLGKASILIGVLAFVALLFSAAGLFVFQKLNRINYDSGQIQTDDVATENVAVETEETETEDVLTEDDVRDLEDTQTVLSDMEIFSDSDIYNILLLGTDERKKEFSTNARADSIMILSLSKEQGSMKLVSLERGMGVPILEGQYQGQYDWLTHCFRYGGADLMMKEIRECLRVDVDRYVRVNFNTFEQLINAVGGVDIELTEAEVKGLNGLVRTNARTKHEVVVGLNHLDGYDALQYSRLRYIDSDWKRIQRQRNVIQSVVKAAKGKNLVEINGIMDTVLPLIQTNLTKMEILELAMFAPNVLGADFEQMSIPQKGTYGGMKGMGGRSLYAVDFEKNAQILRDFLEG